MRRLTKGLKIVTCLIDSLTEKIIRLKAPVVVGLDPVISQIPSVFFAGYDDTLEGTAGAIYDFNTEVVDAIRDIVPAVKPQIAFYETLGHAGILSFEKTVAYAKRSGLIVIEDGKRNDIGNTAEAYANGHLGKVRLRAHAAQSPFGADFLTVSPFLGPESLAPFIRVCKAEDKGVFILARTSNSGSRMIQDARDESGRTVSVLLAQYINEQAQKYKGGCGYSSIGGVVGATYPEEAAVLRKMMKDSLLLVPGYGAQGGSADDILPCFNPDGLGAIVNSSRGILYSYLDKYDMDCTKAEYRECVAGAASAMRQSVYAALKGRYPEMIY
jgi:orotidine-5'-phosphate decarboxylase